MGVGSTVVENVSDDDLPDGHRIGGGRVSGV